VPHNTGQFSITSSILHLQNFLLPAHTHVCFLSIQETESISNLSSESTHSSVGELVGGKVIVSEGAEVGEAVDEIVGEAVGEPVAVHVSHTTGQFTANSSIWHLTYLLSNANAQSFSSLNQSTEVISNVPSTSSQRLGGRVTGEATGETVGGEVTGAVGAGSHTSHNTGQFSITSSIWHLQYLLLPAHTHVCFLSIQETESISNLSSESTHSSVGELVGGEVTVSEGAEVGEVVGELVGRGVVGDAVGSHSSQVLGQFS